MREGESHPVTPRGRETRGDSRGPRRVFREVTGLLSARPQLIALRDRDGLQQGN